MEVEACIHISNDPYNMDLQASTASKGFYLRSNNNKVNMILSQDRLMKDALLAVHEFLKRSGASLKSKQVKSINKHEVNLVSVSINDEKAKARTISNSKPDEDRIKKRKVDHLVSVSIINDEKAEAQNKKRKAIKKDEEEEEEVMRLAEIKRQRTLRRETLKKMEKTVLFEDSVGVQKELEKLIGYSGQDQESWYYPDPKPFGMIKKILLEDKEKGKEESRLAEIKRQRKLQREELEMLEKSVVVEDNLKVQREFEELIGYRGQPTWYYPFQTN